MILNQASYTQDLLSRHEGIKPRQTPLPLGVQDEVETDVQISQVRRAQALVGELLWLSGRTRPDLCYGVSIMGRLVTKAPTKVLEWGAHVLGYLQSTVDYELRYTKQVIEPSFDDCAAAKKPCLKVYSDASHGPQGGRGQQGLLVTYNGSPVQWESKQQPFTTLSSAECRRGGHRGVRSLSDQQSNLSKLGGFMKLGVSKTGASKLGSGHCTRQVQYVFLDWGLKLGEDLTLWTLRQPSTIYGGDLTIWTLRQPSAIILTGRWGLQILRGPPD